MYPTKKYILAFFVAIFFTIRLFSSADAIEIPQTARTVPLNQNGDKVVISLQDVDYGRRQFIFNCGQCHSGNNAYVKLTKESLASATPSRDNLEALKDYIKKPTTHDGEIEISEMHPNTSQKDIFPELGQWGEKEISAVAGYILTSLNIIGYPQ